jgi:hypothetical protein
VTDQPEHSADVIVVGGLTALIIAVALAHRPHGRLLLLQESRPQSALSLAPFSLSGLEEDHLKLVAPAEVAAWPSGYSAVGGAQGHLGTGISLVQEAQLHAELSEASSGGAAYLGVQIQSVEPNVVRTNRGSFAADSIVDARNDSRGGSGHIHLLTQEVLLASPHRLDRPILVDCEPEGNFGWSFLQYFPVAADRLLVRGVGHGESGLEIPICTAEGEMLRSTRSTLPISITWPDKGQGVLSLPSGGVDPILPSEIPLALKSAHALACCDVRSLPACTAALEAVWAEHIVSCSTGVEVSRDLAERAPWRRSAARGLATGL